MFNRPIRPPRHVQGSTHFNCFPNCFPCFYSRLKWK
uniref:Uncharacterized protein n=1 Tax=Anguilla anguilla TaxID=7936 RepID=A0A0E9UYQ9_ANGAN